MSDMRIDRDGEEEIDTTCESCEGMGEHFSFYPHTHTCQRCDGTGVDREKAHEAGLGFNAGGWDE